MTRDRPESDERGIKRRTVLRGAMAGAGIAGMSGLATARGHGGGPCHKDFEECGEDETYVKFNFVIETDDEGNIIDCYFQEETDTGLITIDSFTSKEGEVCEPIEVEWSVAEGYSATKVMAYGGQDCVTATDPDPSQPFEPGLEGPSGQTAAISNLQFCVEERDVVELPADSYIGYEDRPASGDFDYNDFGMRADISETYLDNELQSIVMEFTARFHRAGDDHEIHIERAFGGSVEYDYTVTRSETASGNEVAGGSGSDSGTLDLVLFDTSANFTQNETVTVELTVTSGSVSPPTTSPRPDVAANNALFEVYDPYMVNTSQSTTIDLGTIQDNVDKDESNWDNVADVPNIIVVPDTDFVAPSEGTTITADYPDFDDYYADDNADTSDTDGDLEVNDTYDDWFDTS